MQVFQQRLRALVAAQATSTSRTWVYAPYDQLTDRVGPLSRHPSSEVGLLLIESPEKAARRPYHKQKLAWILANQRHFALEQAARGVLVRYEVGDYRTVLERASREVSGLRVMRPAERELRLELEPLAKGGQLVFEPHEGFLSAREDFHEAVGTKPPWRMDVFYKYMRQKTRLLMDGGKPVGGRYSFDVDNRKKWKGSPPSPTLPTYGVDTITAEVGDLIARAFRKHPGELHLDRIPTSADDAERHWSWALSECLPDFGPYEDAMSIQSPTLFHSCISPLLNLHRLLPARVVRDVAHSERIPLASREGFVRQILGWREFVRHVHDETDGFRALESNVGQRSGPGDGGFSRWNGQPWPETNARPNRRLAGATPSALEAHRPIPPVYWGQPSGLRCLDHVVSTVLRDGFSHHITRLMVLSNIATLLGIEPRDVTDWFWATYIDAFDWVVEPNVLGMGTFAVADAMTTKPYVSGASYIHKMSDYCEGCAFDPKSTCPITRMYWAFLERHAERFARNPRTSGPVASLRKRSPAERKLDLAVSTHVYETLAKGEPLDPGTLPSASVPD